jgi:Protein of unknown function (DUF3551)
MRILTLTLMAVLAFSMTGPARAQTYNPDYPVCLHVYGNPTYYQCDFTSIPQCAQTASGRAAQCVVNPYFANAAEPIGPRHRRHRHN